MRRTPFLLLLAVSCGSDQSLEHDLDPIPLARAPIVPGGSPIGGLLAQVTTASGTQPLLIDSAYPMDSLARSDCAGGGIPGWTYTGDMELRDGVNLPFPVRASFRNVGLFDICPGTTGDATMQAAGVMGGPLLANFSVGLVLPRIASASATMTLWPVFPGADDQLAQDGWTSLHFTLRGGGSLAQGNGAPTVTLPDSRIVLAACAAPRSFSTTDAVETCAQGEGAVKVSGQSLFLAVGTGEGPLILSQPAWDRIAAEAGMASDAGTAGDLYTPFSNAPIPAHFLTLPRLALFQGTTDSTWTGACAELARARRIEWALANQTSGACFQPCDADGSQALTTHAYLELGGALDLAVISETSDLMRSLNVDLGPNPHVDGIVGAGTLAGTRLRLDYPSSPQGRVLATCEEGSTRESCWPAASCPGWPANSDKHVCFGQEAHVWAPVCP